MKFIAVICIMAQVNYTYSQTVNINHQKGDVVTKKVIINNYNVKAKDNVLSVGKYIDTTKEIFLDIGSNCFDVSLKQLHQGYDFSEAIGGKIYSSVLRLQLIKGKIYISADINGFDDKYIAMIRNNKLITSKQYHINSSDNYFEVYDDYYIPVLQIELQKKTNMIVITGAFNSLTGYRIVSGDEIFGSDFLKSKLVMSQQEKNEWYNEYFLNAKKRLKPIHE